MNHGYPKMEIAYSISKNVANRQDVWKLIVISMARYKYYEHLNNIRSYKELDKLWKT